ncbi:pyrrolo-quinoline quinone, partial [Micromonospora chalcea]
GGKGWLVTDPGEPSAAPGLDAMDTVLDGERVVDTSGPVVVGRSARTGAELWRRADIHPARVLATEPGRVHLLTDRRELVTVDPLTGATRSSFVLDVGRDGIGWRPGRAYAVDGYVAVERLRESATPEDDDQGYFLMAEPVLLAAT